MSEGSQKQRVRWALERMPDVRRREVNRVARRRVRRTPSYWLALLATLAGATAGGHYLWLWQSPGIRGLNWGQLLGAGVGLILVGYLRRRFLFANMRAQLDLTELYPEGPVSSPPGTGDTSASTDDGAPNRDA